MTIKQRVKRKEIHDSIAVLQTYSKSQECTSVTGLFGYHQFDGVLSLSDMFFKMFRVTSVASTPKSACAHRSLPVQRHNSTDPPVQSAFSLRLYVLVHFHCPCPSVSFCAPHARSRVRHVICLAAKWRGGASVHRGGDGCHQVTSHTKTSKSVQCRETMCKWRKSN